MSISDSDTKKTFTTAQERLNLRARLRQQAPSSLYLFDQAVDFNAHGSIFSP